MKAKYQAIALDIKARHEKGQPVLVGTVSIESFGKIRSIKGFCYTPVQEGNTDGTIFHYNLYQSNDGKEWKGIILNGEFSNIKNNPIPQFVTFGKVLETRYLKLEPIEEINGNQKTSIAEFSVVIP